MLKLGFKPSEEYWANVRKLVSSGRQHRVICFCGSGPGVGTSSIAASYASLLAGENGAEVLLVDGQIVQPAVARLTEVEPVPGLADFLWSNKPPSSPIKSTDIPGLDVVPAGSRDSYPMGASAAVMTTPKWHEALQQWRERYGTVVIDTDPLLARSNAMQMATQSDAVVVVCRWHETRREVLAQIRRQLENVQANLLGVVVNRRRYLIPGWLYRRI